MNYLPNRLHSGDRLESSTGTRLVVRRTNRKDSHGEPLYRLLYASGVTGNTYWSRDKLQEAGCRLSTGQGGDSQQ